MLCLRRRIGRRWRSSTASRKQEQTASSEIGQLDLDIGPSRLRLPAPPPPRLPLNLLEEHKPEDDATYRTARAPTLTMSRSGAPLAPRLAPSMLTFTIKDQILGIGLREEAGGVVIGRLKPGSQAEALGVPIGGKIISVDTEPAATTKKDLSAQLADGWRPVTLLIAPPVNAVGHGHAAGGIRQESYRYINKWESQIKDASTPSEPTTERAITERAITERARGQGVALASANEEDEPVYLPMAVGGGQRAALEASPSVRGGFHDQFRSKLRRAVVDQQHPPAPNALAGSARCNGSAMCNGSTICNGSAMSHRAHETRSLPSTRPPPIGSSQRAPSPEARPPPTATRSLSPSSTRAGTTSDLEMPPPPTAGCPGVRPPPMRSLSPAPREGSVHGGAAPSTLSARYASTYLPPEAAQEMSARMPTPCNSPRTHPAHESRYITDRNITDRYIDESEGALEIRSSRSGTSTGSSTSEPPAIASPRPSPLGGGHVTERRRRDRRHLISPPAARAVGLELVGGICVSPQLVA